MNKIYSLMSYDWESKQEWLFTHKKIDYVKRIY